VKTPRQNHGKANPEKKRTEIGENREQKFAHPRKKDRNGIIIPKLFYHTRKSSPLARRGKKKIEARRRRNLGRKLLKNCRKTPLHHSHRGHLRRSRQNLSYFNGIQPKEVETGKRTSWRGGCSKGKKVKSNMQVVSNDQLLFRKVGREL